MKVLLVVDKVKQLMAAGVYAPEAIFDELYNKQRIGHYATVRRAIHIAKASIFQ